MGGQLERESGGLARLYDGALDGEVGDVAPCERSPDSQW
jgi:hypothetical protein